MGRFCSGAALRMRGGGAKPVIAFRVVLFQSKASFFFYILQFIITEKQPRYRTLTNERVDLFTFGRLFYLSSPYKLSR